MWFHVCLLPWPLSVFFRLLSFPRKSYTPLCKSSLRFRQSIKALPHSQTVYILHHIFSQVQSHIKFLKPIPHSHGLVVHESTSLRGCGGGTTHWSTRDPPNVKLKISTVLCLEARETNLEEHLDPLNIQISLSYQTKCHFIYSFLPKAITKLNEMDLEAPNVECCHKINHESYK